MKVLSFPATRYFELTKRTVWSPSPIVANGYTVLARAQATLAIVKPPYALRLRAQGQRARALVLQQSWVTNLNITISDLCLVIKLKE